MPEIDKIRDEIDLIHSELARLFRRRLALTQKIWEIKKNNQLSFIDPKREEAIIHRFDQVMDDESERLAMQNFFRSVLTVSRAYLEEKLK